MNIFFRRGLYRGGKQGDSFRTQSLDGLFLAPTFDVDLLWWERHFGMCKNSAITGVVWGGGRGQDGEASI